ncbi:aminotransferase class I/II-fold pyridoxal phosphate-dependent enzyme [bacterium]|nr:aminotransferase class I/II-fold pyridoxal phosphate-dependent enzyme [bacterium]
MIASEPFSYEFSDRLKNLPPYIFAKIDKIKQEELKKGRKLISLGIGDPDLPTPSFIIDRLCHAAKNPSNHQYPSYWGMLDFRKAAARWYEDRFGVKLNPENQVLALIGSKEGIAHIPLAFLNAGDATLVPNPGYPVYHSATLFAGGVPLHFALKEENQFLPDFPELERLVQSGPRVKLLFLNYPNNPTSASASLEFFKEVVRFAKKHNIIVCHDNAYSEIYFDGHKQPSFLQVPGAMNVGCEFHSLSKTFNMTGWRVGFVVGHQKIIEGLAQVKTNIDSGIFNACQEAGIEALNHSEPFCSELRSIYQKRRDILIPALQSIGLNCPTPDATFYAWAKLPSGVRSEQFVMDLIQKTGIVATPGNGFGEYGEGYVRFTFCSDISVLKQVAEALKASV